MSNDTLQIMVTGPGIGNAEVSADYPGVTLAEQVKLDSPNYKFLYFTIAPDARPGKMPITFSLDGRKTTIDYPLLARDRKGEDYQGFDASDVLYLLMPDRFAKGEYTVPADAKLGYNLSAFHAPRRQYPGHPRPSRLHRLAGCDGHMELPRARKRYAGRFVPRLRHHQLL